jgi:hypothetical protein
MCHVGRHVPGSAVCALAWLVMDSEGEKTGVNMYDFGPEHVGESTQSTGFEHRFPY